MSFARNIHITNRTDMRIIIIFLLLSLYLIHAKSQTAWSLDDCIRYGVEQNLKLKNSKLDTKIAHENYVGAIGNFLPEVSTSGNLGKHFGRSVDPKTNLYTSSSFVEGNIGLNISLPLFDGFIRINRLKFDRLNSRISKLNAQIKGNDISYQIMEVFYKLCFEEKMWKLAIEQRKLSEQYLTRTKEYMTLGLKSSSDLQEMKARLQSDIYQETVRKNNCNSYLLYLKELLNFPTVDSLQITYETDDTTLFLQNSPLVEDIYQQSKETMPQFRAVQLQQEAAQKSLALATGKFSPSIRADFSISSGYYNTERDGQGNIIPLSNQLKNNQSKYIGISISFPILYGLSRFTEVRKERLRVKQAENNLAQQKITLYTEIDDAVQQFYAAIAEHRQALEQLHAEEISLHENEEKWAEGLISVFELMEKRNRYISAKAELSRTRLQYEIKNRMIKFYRTGTFTPLN